MEQEPFQTKAARRHSPAAVALTVALGLAIAGALLGLMGVFQPGAEVLGVPLGARSPTVWPGGNPRDALAEEMEQLGVAPDWQYADPWKNQVVHSRSRGFFFNAVVVGKRAGLNVRLRVSVHHVGGDEWKVIECEEEAL